MRHLTMKKLRFEVMKEDSYIQDKFFGHASKLLLKKKSRWSMIVVPNTLRYQSNQLYFPVRLTLSSIVNLMLAECYDAFVSILSQEKMTLLERSFDNTNIGLSVADMTMLRSVLER